MGLLQPLPLGLEVGHQDLQGLLNPLVQVLPRDHGDPLLPGPTQEVVLDEADLLKVLEVALLGPGVPRLPVAEEEAVPVQVLVLHRHEHGDGEDPVLVGVLQEAGHHVDPFQDDGGALQGAPLLDGLEAHGHLGHLV